jgi:hypothetical protein
MSKSTQYYPDKPLSQVYDELLDIFYDKLLGAPFPAESTEDLTNRLYSYFKGMSMAQIAYVFDQLIEAGYYFDRNFVSTMLRDLSRLFLHKDANNQFYKEIQEDIHTIIIGLRTFVNYSPSWSILKDLEKAPNSSHVMLEERDFFDFHSMRAHKVELKNMKHFKFLELKAAARKAERLLPQLFGCLTIEYNNTVVEMFLDQFSCDLYFSLNHNLFQSVSIPWSEKFGGIDEEVIANFIYYIFDIEDLQIEYTYEYK